MKEEQSYWCDGCTKWVKDLEEHRTVLVSKTGTLHVNYHCPKEPVNTEKIINIADKSKLLKWLRK